MPKSNEEFFCHTGGEGDFQKGTGKNILEPEIPITKSPISELMDPKVFMKYMFPRIKE